MQTELTLAVLVGLAVGLLFSWTRVASVNREVSGLARLEAKVDALLKHAGIAFDPFAETPQPVVDALRAGDRILAIKHYRQATGVGLREAKDYVDELVRRAARRA